MRTKGSDGPARRENHTKGGHEFALIEKGQLPEPVAAKSESAAIATTPR
jgi:hypothetical protein